MRDKLRGWIDGVRRKHGEKIITAIDALLIIAAVLIVLALAEIRAAQ